MRGRSSWAGSESTARPERVSICTRSLAGLGAGAVSGAIELLAVVAVGVGVVGAAGFDAIEAAMAVGAVGAGVAVAAAAMRAGELF